MKYIILFFLTAIVGTAQKNHIAHYNINYLFETDNSGAGARFTPYLDEAKRYESDVELVLIFNKERAVFEMFEDNKNSANDWSFSLCGCDKPLFMNAINKTVKYYSKGLRPMGIPEDKYLLVNDLFLDWELHDEEKDINGFTTYKATRTRTDVQGNKILITAWYAPEFPYPYGPLNYGGLPGLIVQVQEGNKMFVLSKIEFDKNTVIPTEPTQGEVMTAEEYKKMEYETYLNMSKR